ncbi:MAG: flagellar protein [Lachnospiraceae bacterium]|nr:flagellar protein [Lachnospiraceae bacterium]
MKVVNNSYPSIEQVAGQLLNAPTSVSNQTTVDGQSFSDILRQKASIGNVVTPVRFSKHASIRLDDRNIELSDEQIDRLNEGTQKANAKGINESLVLVDELAFIVNIKNNTVITAMDQSEARENVFTNIDGAVIA